jgi:hypothetical protein
MKRTVPLFITGIVGTLLIVSYFVPRGFFRESERLIPGFFNIIAAFAFVLGGGNLLRVHLVKISKRDHEWAYSVVTVVGFLVMLVAGLFKLGSGGNMQVALSDSRLWFDRLYQGVFNPCQSTMFSLLAFFVASASYRAFRAKTPEATVLLLAAFVILLGRTPVGVFLAGQRTIQIGIALGIISNSLRLILGIERSHLGGGD